MHNRRNKQLLFYLLIQNRAHAHREFRYSGSHQKRNKKSRTEIHAQQKTEFSLLVVIVVREKEKGEKLRSGASFSPLCALHRFLFCFCSVCVCARACVLCVLCRFVIALRLDRTLFFFFTLLLLHRVAAVAVDAGSNTPTPFFFFSFPFPFPFLRCFNYSPVAVVWHVKVTDQTNK